MSNSFDSWENELCHYGVLGMKWGERRYQNKDGSLTPLGQKHHEQTGEYGYVYKSHATKKYDRKAAKQRAKGNLEKAEKFQKRADRSREFDKREQAYAKSTTVAKNIGLRLLTGGAVGGKAYQQHLAMQNSTSKGAKVVAALDANFGGAYVSRFWMKRNAIRAGENRKGLGKANAVVYGLLSKGQKAASNVIDDALNTVEDKKK